MKPYYADDLVTLYHGDCREILPQLDKANLVLSDPPYRFASKGGGFYGNWHGNGHEPRTYMADLAALDCTEFDPAWLLSALPDAPVVLCCNKSLLADYIGWTMKRGWLFDVHFLWKSNPIPAKQSHFLHDVEYVVVMRPPGSTWQSDAPYDCYRKAFRAVNDGEKLHPAEKPLGLMRKYIAVLSRPGDLVVDPYSGSGTTLLAARDLQRRAIGIELDESHCRTTVQRLCQNVLDLGGVA